MGHRAPSLPVREPRRAGARLIVALFALALWGAEGGAQTVLPPDPGKTIGRPVPLDGLIDERDRDLAAWGPEPDVSGQPRAYILSPIYTRCPHTCSPITSSLRSALEQSGLAPSEFRVISVSFDPEETADGLRAFRSKLQLPDEWVTLRARSPEGLARTLESLDFRTIRTRDGQYDHPNLVAILTPDLRLDGYLFGVVFSPPQLAAVVRRAAAGGSWLGRWQGWLFVVAGVGLVVSAFVFFTLLQRRGTRQQGHSIPP